MRRSLRSLLRLRLRCPFCQADRFALRAKRQRSLALTPPPAATLSVLPGGSLRSPGKKATFADAHSSACGYAVRFARRIACGSPGKKATLADAHSSACGYAVRFAKRIACGSPGKKAWDAVDRRSASM